MVAFPDERVGLCAVCTWMRRITSSRDRTFYLCGLSQADSRYPKYPALPVRVCPGFEPVDPSTSRSTTE